MTWRPVLKGEEIRVAVVGGIVRRPAPEDGVELDFAETVDFMTTDELRAALNCVHGRRTLQGQAKRGKR